MWFSLLIQLTKQYRKILKKHTNSDTKNTFTRKYTNRSKYKLELKPLTLSAPCISKSDIKIKIKLIFSLCPGSGREALT